MIKFAYKHILKPLLFKFDPELVHDVFVNLGASLGRYALGRGLVRSIYGPGRSNASIRIDGITYRSPVGMAAGFDYNGRLTGVLGAMSFGAVEVGSVTARPCEGNPRPRMRRMIKSKGLVVYKGLRNDGVDRIIERLKKCERHDGLVVGVSIAKTNDPCSITLEEGIEDYAYSFKRLNEEGVGDFYTINISCPNVHGGENFAEPGRLRKLLARLGETPCSRPVYVKMPIDQPWERFEELLEVIREAGVQGVVIGNLNKDYDLVEHQDERPVEFRGGLSGSTCRALSTDLIRRTRRKYPEGLTIIGCGGILSVADAMEKLDAGADMLQLITGMIFEGPHLMGEIARAFAARKASEATGRPQRVVTAEVFG
jgi:dihydroorotate dehydrogenase